MLRPATVPTIASLSALPLELLYQITSTFSVHELASLALVNRALFAKLGTSSPLLNGSVSKSSELIKSKTRLLSLLSRDPTLYPYLIACPACAVFHSPFPTEWWTRSAGDQISLRACEAVLHASRRPDSGGEGDYWEGMEVMAPYLPLQCHFNMLAGVMRAARCGWSQHGWEAGTVLNSVDEMTLDGEAEGDGKGWRVHRYHEFKVTNGHLLMKTERLFWLPRGSTSRPIEGDRKEEHETNEDTDTDGTKEENSATKEKNMEEKKDETTTIRNALKKLKEAMNNKGQWGMRYCCQHVWWEEYLAVFDDPEAIWWQKGQGDRSISVCDRCKKPHAGEVERVQPCESCYTDHSVGFVEIPDDQRWAGVFTTWKDLGSCESLDSPEWQSHLRGGAFSDRKNCNPPIPDIYLAWEGLAEDKETETRSAKGEKQDENGEKDVRVSYKPLIRSTRLKRLRGRQTCNLVG